MRWLTVQVFILSIFFALATSLVIFFGRIQPIQPFINVLHLNKCQLPCWNDIVPGKTSLNEAKLLLYNAYSKEPGVYLNYVVASDSYVILNQFREKLIELHFMRGYGGDDAPISEVVIDLSYTSAPLSIGQIYRYMPLLTYVDLGGNWVLHFSTWSLQGLGKVNSCSNYKRIGLTDYVVLITLGEKDTILTQQFSDKWRGFRTCYK